MQQHNVLSLVSSIREASVAYYVDSAPIMSDDEFDNLVDRLRDVCPDHPVLTTTAWGASSKDWDVPHWTQVTGLSEKKIDNVEHGLLRSSESDTYASLKLDGLTGVVRYDQRGFLIDVLTRGDGEYGKDITAMAIATGKVPMRVHNPNEVRIQVRGEFVLSWRNFKIMYEEGLCKEDTHPRNVAAGCMNGSDPEKAKYVDFIAFNLQTDLDGEWGESGYCSFEHGWVKSLGIEYVDYVSVGYLASMDLKEELQSYWDQSTREDQYAYPLDGLVLRSAAGKLKIKFPTKDVQEMEIIVNLRKTRTGRIIPHASFKEAKFIGGCWIDNATLNNVQWIRDRNIWTGARVMVRRSNEIIPQVVEVLEGRPVPSNEELARIVGLDPSKVYMEDTDLVFDCPDHQEFQVVRRMIKDSFVKGMGESTFNQIYEGIARFYLKNFDHDSVVTLEHLRSFVALTKDMNDPFLREMAQKDFQFGPAGTELFLQFIKHFCAMDREVYVSDVLYFLSIFGYGDAKIDKVVSRWSVEQDVLKLPYMFRIKNFIENVVPDDKRILAQLIFNFYNHKIMKFESRKAVEQAAAPVKDETGLVRFSMTGKIEGFQKAGFAEIVAHLAVWDDKDYEIIVTDTDRMSSKLEKALKNGKKVMKSTEFLKHVGMA